MNSNMQEALRKLMDNPKEFLASAGANVPDDIVNDPQAIVMHLIRTGQVSSPALQRITQMMQNMGRR